MAHSYHPILSVLVDYKKKQIGATHIVPVYISLPDDLAKDPLKSFLKLRKGNHSVFWECSDENEPTKSSFAVLATEPWNTITSGRTGDSIQGDPLPHLDQILKSFVVPPEFKLTPPILNGAALGYIGYDCVKYFEPRVAKYSQSDPLQIPESQMMFYNSFVYFDYKSKNHKIVALCVLDENLESNYNNTILRIQQLYDRLTKGAENPYKNRNIPHGEFISHAGKDGYQEYVKKLKEYIIDGYIIQAVPSQRWERESGVHPFHFFQKLRQINPSRYTFYIECGEFEIVGASPELLVKIDDRRLVNHPIAGTRKRGSTSDEDLALKKELLSDEKERAEHIMLVDLGRNDVNRVCLPETTNVDSLMHVEYFSHVMHIVSQVSGQLRPECTPFDAFRSIFPAGTVSGAPKVQAMELVASLESAKRGIYAGAIGYFSFDCNIDTCIAIRTALFKNGKYYFQAGGGIVYDSDPVLENEETFHKMAALARALVESEKSLSSEEAVPVDISSLTLQSDTSNPLLSQFQSLGVLKSHPTPDNSHPVSNIPHSCLSKPSATTTLLIDNYDSFTWNLYQYLSKLGENVIVYRHDKITVEECLALKPDHVMISPGPGWPKDSGVSNDVLKAFMGKVPILGVCLGHECLTELFGGEIIHCGEVKHGKTSLIKHDGKGVYKNLPEELEVIRYHSLAANIKRIPDEFYVTSKTTDTGVIMGIRHEKFKVEGVQFHPESIKTDHGIEMLKNFLSWKGPTWDEN